MAFADSSGIQVVQTRSRRRVLGLANLWPAKPFGIDWIDHAGT